MYIIPLTSFCGKEKNVLLRELKSVLVNVGTRKFQFNIYNVLREKKDSIASLMMKSTQWLVIALLFSIVGCFIFFL